MDIKEGNKLIAEFMGVPLNNNGWVPINRPGITPYSIEPNYHDSWDWLMPVVEKLSKIDGVSIELHQSNHNMIKVFYNPEPYDLKTFITKQATLIESVWICCTNFIQWYNENCETRKLDPKRECKQEDKRRCTYPKCECMSMMR